MWKRLNPDLSRRSIVSILAASMAIFSFAGYGDPFNKWQQNSEIKWYTAPEGEQNAPGKSEALSLFLSNCSGLSAPALGAQIGFFNEVEAESDMTFTRVDNINAADVVYRECDIAIGIGDLRSAGSTPNKSMLASFFGIRYDSGDIILARDQTYSGGINSSGASALVHENFHMLRRAHDLWGDTVMNRRYEPDINEERKYKYLTDEDVQWLKSNYPKATSHVERLKQETSRSRER